MSRRRIFRPIEDAVRGVFRGTVRGFDTVTGDILDLDQSKQKDMIEAQKKAEEEAERKRQEAERLAKEKEAQAKKEADELAKAQADYDQQVANTKDKIGNDDSLTPDDTGVGLSGVNTDFSTSSKLTNEEKDDDLKKLLRK